MTTTTYLLMLWGDPDADFDVAAAYAAHGRFASDCLEHGHELLGGEELASPSTARLLRVGDGGTEPTEGPYAETTEHLGGFYRVRTSDPDGLLRLAAPLVADDGGTLELRPEVLHDDGSADDLAEAGADTGGAATYLLLLRGDLDATLDLDAVFADHDRFAEQCAAQGHAIVGGEELASPRASRLLRATPTGDVTLSDGPYAETTEQLGGYYLVRTTDPDALLRLAAGLLEHDPGIIELRRVQDQDAQHDAAGTAAAAEAS